VREQFPSVYQRGPRAGVGALMHISGAIDHGSGPANLTVGLRGPGYRRTYGLGTDIGACEWQSAPDDRVFNRTSRSLAIIDTCPAIWPRSRR